MRGENYTIYYNKNIETGSQINIKTLRTRLLKREQESLQPSYSLSTSSPYHYTFSNDTDLKSQA
jgi:hypothetical protein